SGRLLSNIMENNFQDFGAANPVSRRSMLRLLGGGFGSLAMTGLLGGETRAMAGDASRTNPLAGKISHFPARAKRVIFLFMPGGPSQVDTFDPKPRLIADNGKPAPKLYLGQQRNLLAS